MTRELVAIIVPKNIKDVNKYLLNVLSIYNVNEEETKPYLVYTYEEVLKEFEVFKEKVLNNKDKTMSKFYKNLNVQTLEEYVLNFLMYTIDKKGNVWSTCKNLYFTDTSNLTNNIPLTELLNVSELSLKAFSNCFCVVNQSKLMFDRWTIKTLLKTQTLPKPYYNSYVDFIKNPKAVSQIFNSDYYAETHPIIKSHDDKYCTKIADNIFKEIYVQNQDNKVIYLNCHS
jgi:hypothetical protein